MSRDVNQVILNGYLGQDPEIFKLGSKPPFAKLRLATTKRWKKNGEKHSKTTWHTILLSGQHVELAEQYLRKGHEVLVIGELATKAWKDNEGRSRISVYVQARQLKLPPKGPRRAVNDPELSTAVLDDMSVDEDIPF